MQRRRRGLPDGDPRHGTTNAYDNFGCRCDACKAANTRVLAQRKAARLARGLAPDDPRHGTDNGYRNWGCRCAPCTIAATNDSYVTLRRRRAREDAS
jgi:hypothetical protein